MAFGRLFGKKAGKHSEDKPGGRSVDELTAELQPDDPAGPYDAEDMPDDDVERLDLGALLVPKVPQTEIRMEGNKAGELTGVLVVDGSSGVHMVACAAPRRDGLWDEVRGSLLENLAKDAHSTEVVAGEFGPEIRAVMKTPQGEQAVRFVGIDGPRWMLRAVFSGAAGADPNQGEVLNDVVRQTVVVRGAVAMPVRDPLPLRLPKEATAVADDDKQPEADELATGTDGRPRMAPPKRGVETSEIR